MDMTSDCKWLLIMTLSQLRLCHRLFLQDEYKPIYTLSIVGRWKKYTWHKCW